MKAEMAPEIVDLARYPIDALESSEGRAFLEDCRTALGREGSVLLPDFLKPEFIPLLIAEAEAGGARSRHFVRHFPYATQRSRTGRGTCRRTIRAAPSRAPRSASSPTA